MSEVTVAYNDTVIHEADAGEAFTLNTEGKYMEGDVVVVVAEGIPEATGEEF